MTPSSATTVYGPPTMDTLVLVGTTKGLFTLRSR